MAKETISQTEGLCKEVTICIRDAYDRGYKQGFKDGTKSEYEHDRAIATAYNDGQIFILDKIRAEIESKIIKRPKMDFRYSERERNEALLDVLQIIDKYREVRIRNEM